MFKIEFPAFITCAGQDSVPFTTITSEQITQEAFEMVGVSIKMAVDQYVKQKSEYPSTKTESSSSTKVRKNNKTEQ